MGNSVRQWFQKVIDFFRGKNRRASPWGAGVDPGRSGANAARAIALVQGATHPGFTDRDGRRQLRAPGTGRVGGTWVVAGNTGGYYIYQRRECYTVCNPHDPHDYEDWVEQHETGHDLEYQLGLSPPSWHYAPWSRLFRNWFTVPYATVAASGEVGRLGATVQHLALPGVCPGDCVVIDRVLPGVAAWECTVALVADSDGCVTV